MNEEIPFVCVVDDDSSMRDSLSNLIRSAGLSVQTFASAQEFLRTPRPDAPSCLVLDVQLPGRSSRAQARTALGREFPILTLSIVRRGPNPTVAHVSCAPSKIPDSGF